MSWAYVQGRLGLLLSRLTNGLHLHMFRMSYTTTRMGMLASHHQCVSSCQEQELTVCSPGNANQVAAGSNFVNATVRALQSNATSMKLIMNL